MSGWIISICGISLLSVLVDAIVPDGNTKKYVRTVIGIVLTFSMLLPIANLFTQTAKTTQYLSGEIVTQQDLLQGVQNQYQLARLQKVDAIFQQHEVVPKEISLQPNGYVCVKVNCNLQTLQQLQRALGALGDKIMILWSTSSE